MPCLQQDFTSTEDMRNYLKTNYPQVEDWDSVLEEDVAAKFVSTPVSYFPEARPLFPAWMEGDPSAS